ncbi:DMT family transporter [Defluviimonas sp. WL0002]|uniref:DMT family transporter n=1 Tax=Albidovulum marisflavi TaxID=2984159 RepID=A0ABT2ZAY8_9RHOB|nr:DMT family transporter [Defluviimonas sp. WL0002]MCV2868271.1 DMT family transporter [Defluviimonas sp. WL0002]
MTTAAATMPANRTLAAAGAILIYAFVIGFTDNYVQLIAADTGLWQFHATRTAMAFVILALAAVPLGLRLRPRNWRAVGFRSLVHGSAMVVYFGCLAFLPVAVVAAGLFTAPIFVLLISRFAFGMYIGPFRILAVAVGFLGVMMVLGPDGDMAIGPATLLPVAAGALYALGNIATRQWCRDESAETMLAGFFAALGTYGLLGLVALALWQPEVPAGTDGFILRGAVWPSATFLFWTFVQAAGSLLGVGMMVKAYQMAEASRVAVFEYVILPASAFWTWAIWGDLLSLRAMAGMALIFLAGLIIAVRGK